MYRNRKCDISLVSSADTQKHTIFKLWQSAWDSSLYKFRMVKDVFLGWWKMSSENGNHQHILLKTTYYMYMLAYWSLPNEPWLSSSARTSSYSQQCATLLIVEPNLLECPDFNTSQERYLLGHSLQTVLGDNIDNFLDCFYFFRPLDYMIKFNFPLFYASLSTTYLCFHLVGLFTA